MRRPAIEPESARFWLHEIFRAKAALKGGVVRRSVAWVEHEIGRETLIDEVRRRGFHMLECGGQFAIVCRPGPVHLIV